MFDFKPQHFIMISFIAVILIGTILLKLPFATTAGEIKFIDALFTATSATCVTGLAVLDTGSDFTFFGQFVILLLIQIGGLGFMTISIFFILLLGQKLSIKSKLIIQESITQYPFSNLKRMLFNIFLLMLFFESIGAIIMYHRFKNFYHYNDALWQAVFHSVSAFCNAGFSLFSSSLINFADDPYIIGTISILIIVGGLGFLTLYELKNILIFKKRWRRNAPMFSFHAKITLITSLALIVIGFIFIYVFEYNISFAGYSLNKKILAALFHSVTPRTAGFNSVDMTTLTAPVLLFTMILMFIGGSSGSTAGGIKIGSFFVLVNYFYMLVKGKSKIMVFKRMISEDLVKRCLAVFFISLLIIIFTALLLMISENPDLQFDHASKNFLEILFETVSAYGTVGLSLGLTPHLSETGRLIITVLMFIGRVGPMLIALTLFTQEDSLKYEYPQENILIG